MPLDREHTTQASRIMLPTYAILFALLGLMLIFQDQARTSSEAFDVAKMVMPIYLWGWLFIAVAFMEGTALWVHKRGLYLAGLTVGVGLVTFWAVVLTAAAFLSPVVSFTGAVWVGGWIAAHLATALSLAHRER